MKNKDPKLEELKKSILATLADMVEVRTPTEAIRWEACGLVKHRTHNFNLGESPIKKIDLYSTKAVEATNTAVNGIMGYLISQNIRWFNVRTQNKNSIDSDELYGAKDYMELVVTTILNMLAQCNFYSSTHLATKDAFVQGTSAEFIINGKDKKIVYDTIDPTEFYIREDENRKVDTFFRVYEIPAKVAFKKWGEKLPYEVKKMIKDGSGHTRVKFLHAIYPREDAYSQKGKILFSTEKPYASIHYSYTGDEVFEESGYDEFPLAIHRWTINGTGPYGSSPIIEIIEEIKKLNKMSLLYMTGADKNANPPIFAPEILKGRLNLNPGGMNYANLKQTGSPEVFPTSLDLDGLYVSIKDKERNIEQALYSDLFNILMRQDQTRTATEVREIKGEGLVLLSSIIGNLQEEKITPLIMRTYNIMLASGLIEQPPKELKDAADDGVVKVELDGPLAQNMKAYHQTTGITQGLEALEKVMSLNQDSVVNIDFDKLIRLAVSSGGMPQTVIREKSEVKKIKEEQLAAIKAQQENEAKIANSKMNNNSTQKTQG